MVYLSQAKESAYMEDLGWATSTTMKVKLGTKSGWTRYNLCLPVMEQELDHVILDHTRTRRRDDLIWGQIL